MILKLISTVVFLRYRFESPVDFYDSQTERLIWRQQTMFESPVDFYDSQTSRLPTRSVRSFESPVVVANLF